jgi:CAI-1 autoinducer synthase
MTMISRTDGPAGSVPTVGDDPAAAPPDGASGDGVESTLISFSAAEAPTLPGPAEAADVWAPAALRTRMAHHFKSYPDGHVTVGRAPRSDDIQLASNDYLALGADPRIVAAQVAALTADKDQVFMSGVYTQFLDDQRRLEARFADLMGSEDAALCQSGFAANDGLIQAVADARTPVYLDLFAHASLWQGAHSAGAPAHGFRHNDVDHLAGLIARHGAGVIAVDSVYSTLGDICPLPDLVRLADETGSLLVVDESHALGVVGRRGEGLVAALGLQDRVPLRVAALSKAFVGRGGVIAGPARFVEYFRYESRPAIFSSAVLPSEVARFAATLDIVETEGWRRQRAAASARALRRRLGALGYDVSVSRTPIIPLVAGPEARTRTVRDALEREGVIGAVFCAPATPRNRSLLRLCIHAGVDDATLDRLEAAFLAVRDTVDPASWPTYGRRRRAALRRAA